MRRLLTILMFVCACTISQAQTSVITTIAGKDSIGFCGDYALAVDACLDHPFSVFVDRHGNIYIDDAFNNRIRKITVATGLISTVAGNGTNGFSGDNGPATDAELFIPEGIFVDNFDNIYIADALNNRIRKVMATTGVISTVAGNGIMGYTGDNGPATDAQLNQPSDVGLDGFGNLYIADLHNNVIRKVDAITGIIRTVAGTGAAGYLGDNDLAVVAQLNGPVGICLDKNNDLFITEQWNNVIRRVNATTNVITTIAGTGMSGYSGDNDIATNAMLSTLAGIFIDDKNDIFFTQYFNGVVRKIDNATGIITTVAGTGVPGFSGDNGPATAAQLHPDDVFVDAFSTMYIADYRNHRIRRVGGPVGVNDVNSQDGLTIYPNPTTGNIILEANGKECSMVISNVVGEKIFQSLINKTRTEIDITAQPAGVYFVQLLWNGGSEVRKILKQ